VSDTQKWQLLALTVILGGLLYLLAPVLTPFAVAALFAYLCDPLVDRLEARRFSRSLSVSLVFLLFILLWVLALLILVPMLERQVMKLFEQFPKWVSYLQEAILPRVEQYTGTSLQRLDPSSLMSMLKEHWQQAGGFAQSVLDGLSSSGMALLAWVANLVLLPVLIFYLLRDWDVLIERVRELLPRAIEPTVSRLAGQADDVLGAFLRGQLSVMIALGTIYSLGLMLVGVDLGLLIGMVAGLISFIPYLGAIVGVGAGVVAALVQYGDVWHVVLVLAVFGIGQTVESFLLTPWLVGDRIGLHPVAVIFAIMAGGQLFGFFGVLLALPVAAVAMVGLRYLHERYTASALYGGASPPATVVPQPAPPVQPASPVSPAQDSPEVPDAGADRNP
jgi:predicted PurR-regulated permease PerM